jgi:gliding motility-associated protein GldC
MAKQVKDLSIQVELDDKNIPENISWNATDADSEPTDCRAMILSLWDPKSKDTLRLDLWTKDMTRDEMKIFFHQTLVTMADSLERSIDDARIAGDMRDFCAHFADKMDISD